jgi:hypothetical protein
MSCEIQTASLSVMYELWNINCKPERNVWVVKHFVFHNSYFTLRLTVYISQLIHYAQAYSLYFTTHTLRSGVSLSVMYELWNTNCKPERDVWVVKYKLRLAVYISQLIHHAQAYSLYFTTHASRSSLQFIFHNSYITLRLVVKYKL